MHDRTNRSQTYVCRCRRRVVTMSAGDRGGDRDEAFAGPAPGARRVRLGRLDVPAPLRPRREKVFQNHETRLPLDREAKVRIMHLARCLKRRTEPRRHYGVLTGKCVDDVLHALLWLIHDGRSGQCNPSYETIADKAGCVRSTVAEAIKMLESAGILSWVNRIHRIRLRERDLFGQWATSWRVVRTSNAYLFHDPKAVVMQGKSSKSDFRSGPLDPLLKTPGPVENPPLDPEAPLGRALAGYGRAAGFS